MPYPGIESFKDYVNLESTYLIVIQRQRKLPITKIELHFVYDL